MPITFDNIRDDNDSNVIDIKMNNLSINRILSTKNYTNINTLLSDINAVLAGLNVTFTILDGLVSINFPHINNIIIGNNVLMNYVLGFPKDTEYLSTNKVTATNNYNLNYDNYLSLYLDIATF